MNKKTLKARLGSSYLTPVERVIFWAGALSAVLLLVIYLANHGHL